MIKKRASAKIRLHRKLAETRLALRAPVSRMDNQSAILRNSKRSQGRITFLYTIYSDEHTSSNTIYGMFFTLRESGRFFLLRFLHHRSRPLLALHVEVRIDVRGRSEITVPQPLLNLLERDAMRQQERRAAVAQIVEADVPQTVLRQRAAEAV